MLTKEEVVAKMLVNREELVTDGRVAYVGLRPTSMKVVNQLHLEMRLRLVATDGPLELYRLGLE